MSSSPSFLDPVVLPLIRGDCVLDVACGIGRWGCLMRTNYFESGLAKPPVVDGFDAFAPNVEYVNQLGVYRKVWEAKLPCSLPKGVYSTILASEIMEHLEMEKVIACLDEFEAAARDRVIITTPNWKYLREGSDSFVGFNELDHHLSYVSADFLRKRGYKIYGAGFGNPQSFSVKVFVRAFKLLGVRDFTIFESLSKKFPSLGHTTVAVKDLNTR